jgi:glycerol-3-phosphate dehydrogenase (NAD(P)+)
MKVAIIGTGAWGTALAQVLVDSGHNVLIYGKEITQIDDININHRNKAYFPGDISLDNKIKATNSLSAALEGRRFVVLSVPTVAQRSVMEQIKPLLKRKVTFINTSKGFDSGNNKRMSEVIREVIPEEFRFPIVSLIGPSHAEEVIIRHLTLVTATSLSKPRAGIVAKLFANKYFRVYIQSDEIGAEIGVAMKNAIAIASGVLEGLGLGDNARAALVTRGLAEMVIFGKHFGGQTKTYLGLTGLGDLIVTCYSFHSRNFMAGFQIGKDNSAVNFLANNKATVEGVRTAKTIYEMASSQGLNLPIVEAVYNVLYEGAKPSEMVTLMMNRPLKEE